MILFFEGSSLNKEYQGTKTYLFELLKVFHSSNEIRVKIVIGVNKFTEEVEILSKNENIEIYVYKSSSRLYNLYIEIPLLIKREGINVALFQYFIPFLKPKVCRYFVTIHDVLFLDFPEDYTTYYRVLRKLLFRFSARTSDYIFTVSNYSKERIAYHFRIPKEKISVTPNGLPEQNFKFSDKLLDFNDLKRKYEIGEGKIILYVSRLEPRKNHLQLIEVFQELELNDHGYYLVLIGTPTRLPLKLKGLINNPKFQNQYNIRFINGINNIELYTFYSYSDYFVYPSTSEGFGIPVLEAISFNLPVACSNATAMKDYLNYVQESFNPMDKEEMKQSLCTLIRHNNKPSKKLIDELSLKYNWGESSKILYDGFKKFKLYSKK